MSPCWSVVCDFALWKAAVASRPTFHYDTLWCFFYLREGVEDYKTACETEACFKLTVSPRVSLNFLYRRLVGVPLVKGAMLILKTQSTPTEGQTLPSHGCHSLATQQVVPAPAYVTDLDRTNNLSKVFIDKQNDLSQEPTLKIIKEKFHKWLVTNDPNPLLSLPVTS